MKRLSVLFSCVFILLCVQSATAEPIYNEATQHWYDMIYTAYSGGWYAGESEAQSRGGHLVTINDAAEQAWLNEQFGNEYYFIGLNNPDAREDWFWISGEPVTYTNWIDDTYPRQEVGYGWSDRDHEGKWKPEWSPTHFAIPYSVIEYSGMNPNVVPEPASMLLYGLGGGVMVLLRRRRRSS